MKLPLRNDPELIAQTIAKVRDRLARQGVSDGRRTAAEKLAIRKTLGTRRKDH